MKRSLEPCIDPYSMKRREGHHRLTRFCGGEENGHAVTEEGLSLHSTRNSRTYGAADAELDGGDPLLAADGGFVPAHALLALAIGRESNEVLLDRSVSGARPTLQLSASYRLRGRAEKVPDHVKELKGGASE